jgi:hypothetical protein
MDVNPPKILRIPVSCARKTAPCPHCGQPGRRKRIRTRTVRTVAYKAIALLEITYGEYEARCGCCTTFHNTPDGVLPKAKYDNRVRDLVLERLLDDGMSIERALASIRREFLLDLSPGIRLRRPPRPGRATRHGRASSHGPGALQRDPLRR